MHSWHFKGYAFCPYLVPTSSACRLSRTEPKAAVKSTSITKCVSCWEAHAKVKTILLGANYQALQEKPFEQNKKWVSKSLTLYIWATVHMGNKACSSANSSSRHHKENEQRVFMKGRFLESESQLSMSAMPMAHSYDAYQRLLCCSCPPLPEGPCWTCGETVWLWQLRRRRRTQRHLDQASGLCNLCQWALSWDSCQVHNIHR